MDKFKTTASTKQLERVKSNLEKNNMTGYIAQTKEEAVKIATSILKEGTTVASGGSMTLEECGMMTELRSGKYNYLDREAVVDKKALYRQSFSADFYMCSANAITEKGEIYNVDGNSNRVACICHGPDKVVLIVGRNKVVKDLDEAAARVKRYASPANCQRLSCKTPCYETGVCIGVNGSMADGCKGDGRICCNYVVTAYQRDKERMHIILVNEELGY